MSEAVEFLKFKGLFFIKSSSPSLSMIIFIIFLLSPRTISFIFPEIGETNNKFSLVLE
jgi:hypothetical protein